LDAGLILPPKPDSFRLAADHSALPRRISDRKVVMDDVIEEGDRISSRFTYNGTIGNPFLGYRPNSAPVQMRRIDIRRVKDGKFIEHWDELPLSLIVILGTAVVCGTDMFCGVVVLVSVRQLARPPSSADSRPRSQPI
jgi:hypothetical protein